MPPPTPRGWPLSVPSREPLVLRCVPRASVMGTVPSGLVALAAHVPCRGGWALRTRPDTDPVSHWWSGCSLLVLALERLCIQGCGASPWPWGGPPSFLHLSPGRGPAVAMTSAWSWALLLPPTGPALPHQPPPCARGKGTEGCPEWWPGLNWPALGLLVSPLGPPRERARGVWAKRGPRGQRLKGLSPRLP